MTQETKDAIWGEMSVNAVKLSGSIAKMREETSVEDVSGADDEQQQAMQGSIETLLEEIKEVFESSS